MQEVESKEFETSTDGRIIDDTDGHGQGNIFKLARLPLLTISCWINVDEKQLSLATAVILWNNRIPKVFIYISFAEIKQEKKQSSF